LRVTQSGTNGSGKPAGRIVVTVETTRTGLERVARAAGKWAHIHGARLRGGLDRAGEEEGGGEESKGEAHV